MNDAAWVAVAGYLVGAALCFRQRGRVDSAREQWFWMVAALAMLALGINKQLDLQTALTAWARQMARDGGWFAQRRAVQAVFIKAVMVAALVVGAGLAWLVRGLRARVWVVLAGLMLLGVFVVLRAASFHHIDRLMGLPLLGLKLHAMLELAGIAIVVAGAGWPRRWGAIRTP